MDKAERERFAIDIRYEQLKIRNDKRQRREDKRESQEESWRDMINQEKIKNLQEELEDKRVLNWRSCKIGVACVSLKFSVVSYALECNHLSVLFML